MYFGFDRFVNYSKQLVYNTQFTGNQTWGSIGLALNPTISSSNNLIYYLYDNYKIDSSMFSIYLSNATNSGYMYLGGYDGETVINLGGSKA